MSYCTQQDMVDRFGERDIITLTDIGVPATGAIDVTVLTRALDDASAQIDAYLAARYALPLTSVPQILVQSACDIALYLLHRDPPEPVIKRRDSAVAFLKDLATGKAQLGLTTNEEPATVQYSETTRIFDSDTLKDY